ncbi:PLP-dependent aminotransferase family protein [Candidatus Oleimmundimicrobium sp.]|uniref:aminotransferase-like domain-containing protein n=1 Tax=Candidatus Oleimmundimicrobium sp. TaxID=3060597 RepID=UPI002727D714|nr:PLP-dependent aminotransferase family protein [Candidatus Oleimmundimicrobium sp.]MDO8886855.1 PLP-dependent aminotransferase family protein [Candidatus Oleimmundimicrobium sp.]
MSPEIRFDKWNDLYAERTAALKSSAIRDLFIVASRPDIISFAGGMPDTRSLPIEIVIEATKKVLQKEGPAALQYGPSEGHLGLRKCVSKLMAENNMHVDTDEIIITDGGQQALDLLGKIFINPKDNILVEGPSYVGAIQAFSSYQAKITSLPLDENGLLIDSLVQALEDLKKRNQKAKFIYLVPSFSNPTGITLSLERRKALLKIIKKYDLLAIEDNPYDQLRFSEDKIPTLRSMDNSLIYMGTFSKIFSPGVRLGWVAAPKPIIEKLNFGKQAADLCSSSLTQRIVEEYFTSYPWEKYLKKQTELYKERRDVMLESLDKFFPSDAKWTKPGGGLFLWVTLPEFVNTAEMLAKSINEAKVAYVPGKAFFADDNGKNCMRLNFSYPNKEQISEGIKRLGKLIKSEIKLRQTFTDKLNLNND